MRQQRGFSMLETLIALVIVSVGLLGVAGLIANSLKVNQGAQERSQASWLANDIIDRMRANRATAQTGAYDIGDCNAAPGAGTVAGDDLVAWCGALGASLPAGTGSIVRAGTHFTVTVQWDESSSRLADDAVVAGGGEFVVETRL